MDLNLAMKTQQGYALVYTNYQTRIALIICDMFFERLSCLFIYCIGRKRRGAGVQKEVEHRDRWSSNRRVDSHQVEPLQCSLLIVFCSPAILLLYGGTVNGRYLVVCLRNWSFERDCSGSLQYTSCDLVENFRLHQRLLHNTYAIPLLAVALSGWLIATYYSTLNCHLFLTFLVKLQVSESRSRKQIFHSSHHSISQAHYSTRFVTRSEAISPQSSKILQHGC